MTLGERTEDHTQLKYKSTTISLNNKQVVFVTVADTAYQMYVPYELHDSRNLDGVLRPTCFIHPRKLTLLSVPGRSYVLGLPPRYRTLDDNMVKDPEVEPDTLSAPSTSTVTYKK